MYHYKHLEFDIGTEIEYNMIFCDRKTIHCEPK